MSLSGLAAQVREQKYSQVHLQHKGGRPPGERAASKAARGEAIREAGERGDGVAPGAAGGGGRFQEGLDRGFLEQKDKQNREEVDALTMLLEWAATPQLLRNMCVEEYRWEVNFSRNKIQH